MIFKFFMCIIFDLIEFLLTIEDQNNRIDNDVF